MREDLDRLIREAKARLEGVPISPEDREMRRREEEMDRFTLRVKRKMESTTWAELYPPRQLWHEDFPALEFVIDRYSKEEKIFLLRAIEGGFELTGPVGKMPLVDDREFNDRLLLAIGDQLETVKQG